jgi:serpin B
MKKLLLPVILAAFLLQSCGNGVVKDNPGHPEKLPRSLTSSEKALVSNANIFSYDIFRHVIAADSEKNVFISPLSISMALGMTLNGAAGTTENGIQKTLDMSGMSLHEINKSYKSLIKLLVNLDPKVTINIANSLWSRKGFSIEQSFKDTLQTYFNAQAGELDFTNPNAPNVINHWVSDQTNGRIKKIVQKIPRSVMLYLINATYFKGKWLYKFDPDKTKPALFHLENGSTVQVDMMHRKEAPLAVFSSDEVRMAQLAYGDSLFVMDILMPADPKTTLNSFVQHSLTASNLARWSDRLRSGQAEIALPKFKSSYKKKLNDILKAMGMSEAFSGSADFSRINPDIPLVISNVMHKADITVDEEGSEAAAATSVGIALTSFHGFIVNRPFVYMIRERASGTILFMGVMRDPGD